ncbi:MAG: 50S ribosomal protein L7/L12 [Campylobacteraceae bacterium]|jgi:large subunit ribosomal protein L7/L12|nr:50S ribosomal protein L7/L12 [Campylobacteraceae bacterium]
MAVTKEQVIEFIAGLSVLELSELVKEFEEKFGVSAQPVVMAGAVAGGGAAAAAVEEKTEFDVILASSGEKKINVIKVLRELTGLGLAEAKKASEETPFTVKTGASKAEADEIKAKLEEVGAKVEVK